MARPVKDMVGFKTGKLVVEGPAPAYVNPSGGTSAQWWCRCECGERVIKRGSALRNGSAKSCGCARSSSNRGRGMIDLTGQRFGCWSVVSSAGAGSHRQIMWNCVCDCGVESVVSGASLRNGDSRSCGCLKWDLLRVERYLVGEVFGRWTVMAQAEGDHMWLCRCSCGTQREVAENSLVRGVSTSCGCLCVENAALAWHSKAADLVGQRFGSWTAIERSDVVRYEGGGQTIRWMCRCDCGTERAVLVSALRDGTSQSCGCTTGSRMEAHVAQFLREHGVPFVPQRSFADLRGPKGRPLTFDFEIVTPAGTVLLECQGEQHFRAVEWFGGEEKFAEQVKNDAAKRECAAAEGITLIEIDYRTNTYEAMTQALGEHLSGFWARVGRRAPWEEEDHAA